MRLSLLSNHMSITTRLSSLTPLSDASCSWLTERRSAGTDLIPRCSTLSCRRDGVGDGIHPPIFKRSNHTKQIAKTRYSSALQNDRPLFETTGQDPFVYIVTCKQRFTPRPAKIVNPLTHPPEHIWS